MMDAWDELEKKYSSNPGTAKPTEADPWAALDGKYATGMPAMTAAAPATARAAAPMPSARPEPTSFLGGIGNSIYGLAKGAADSVQGGAQTVLHGANSLYDSLASGPGQPGRGPAGRLLNDVTQRFDKHIADQEAEYQRATPGSVAAGLGRGVAAVAPAMAGGFASNAGPAIAGLGARMGVGAGLGAAQSGIAPVFSGDYADEKQKQIATGAVVGGAAPAVIGGLSRLISPNAARNPQLQMLKDEGVRPTVGQALGGAWNRTEEKLQSLPVVGDAIRSARGNATATFERAAQNRALAPIGETLPDSLTGRAAVLHTESTLNNAYDTVLNKIGAITVDQPFAAKVQSLQGMIQRLVMPPAEKEKFASALNDVTQSIDGNGVITSNAYKALESSLGSDARKLYGSQNIYENKVAPAVKQLQAELRDMLGRQAGDAADELKAVNTGWANFKRVQGAAGKVGAEDGHFTPAQFVNSVRGLDKSKDKGAFARGSALGQDLGDAGKSMLTNKVPNSGTADRLWIGAGALGGGAAINPMIPAGMIAGAAAYTPMAQRGLVGAVSARPAVADPVAEFLRKNSMYLGAGASAAGLLDQ